MEIQQHDGVVVDVAGLRQGFAKLLREREVLQGRREAPKAIDCCPPSPPLYRPPGGGAGPGDQIQRGVRRPRGGEGVPCPPRQVGRPPTLGFPTLGAGGRPMGAPQPTKGWLPSHFSPWGPPG